MGGKAKKKKSDLCFWVVPHLKVLFRGHLYVGQVNVHNGMGLSPMQCNGHNFSAAARWGNVGWGNSHCETTHHSMLAIANRG